MKENSGTEIGFVGVYSIFFFAAENHISATHHYFSMLMN